MAKFKIVTTGPGNTDHSLEMETLAAVGAEIIEINGSDDDLAKAAVDADAIYAKGRPRIPAKVIEAAKKLKVVSIGSVGVDSIDVAVATRLGIPVTNCPDTFIEEVADHAMTLILATWRRLVVQDRLVRNGEWAKARPMLYQYPRLMGQTLGFISFGHVARAVARRAAPFGFTMLAYDPYIEELVMSEYGVQPVSYDELLERSDIISMQAQGTRDAQHLMKEQHFRKMKKTALFVNTGRGSTVDEAAMIKALQEGWIAGAGLDVMEVEPIGHNNPMLGMDNVTLTAHVASASARFDVARKRRAGAEMALVLSGKWPRSCVNPAVLEKSKLERWQPYSMERGPMNAASNPWDWRPLAASRLSPGPRPGARCRRPGF
ncbi:MAG TPA: C-terminal binding protein, partial [Reyranellaceae bacterium]|nr:C-terminal binding protein [Reyranellaceae bacterium]